MADDVNITLGDGTAVIAADEIASVKYQRIKLVHGANGTNDGDVATGNPLPVVQTGTPIIPTGAATSAKQDTGNTSLASIDGKITAVNTGAVTVASSALPSGASTSAKQDTAQTALDAIKTATEVIDNIVSGAGVNQTQVGGTNIDTNSGNKSAGTQRMVLATDQPALTTALPVSQKASTTTSATLQAAATGTGNGSTISADGMATVAFTITGITTATITFEGTEDGTNYVSLVVQQKGSGTPSIASTATADGTFIGACAGLTLVRARISAYTSGTITVTAHTTPQVTHSHSVSANINQIGGSNTATGHGTASGALRVELPTDGTGMVGLNAGTNTNEAVGDAAHGASVAGNPLLNGFEARTSLGTAVAEGQVVRGAANRYGIQLATALPPSHVSSNGTPVTATTTSVIAAPSAGSHLRVVRFHISNGGSTSTWVSIRDGAAGTQHYRTFLPLNGVISLNLNLSGPLDLTSATRLDIVLSAAGSCEYEVDYFTVLD